MSSKMITKSDWAGGKIDLNNTMRRIVQRTLDREYKKAESEMSPDELEMSSGQAVLTGNYTSRALDKLNRKYAISNTDIHQPDGSIKKIATFRITKYSKDESGEWIQHTGYYTACFHMKTHEQQQDGQPSCEFIGGSY